MFEHIFYTAVEIVASAGPVGWMVGVGGMLTLLFVTFSPAGETPSWGSNLKKRG